MICKHTDLFDMQEVFSFKWNPVSRYWNVVIVCRSVGEVCAHSKSNWFILNNREKKRKIDNNKMWQKKEFNILAKHVQTMLYICLSLFLTTCTKCSSLFLPELSIRWNGWQKNNNKLLKTAKAPDASIWRLLA